MDRLTNNEIEINTGSQDELDGIVAALKAAQFVFNTRPHPQLSIAADIAHTIQKNVSKRKRRKPCVPTEPRILSIKWNDNMAEVGAAIADVIRIARARRDTPSK